MFQMRFWYDWELDDQNVVKIIAIRCSNCGKETGLSMDNINTKYKYIVTVFVFNTLLHHVGMLWIIETHEQLKYDKKKKSYWITGGPCYNTSICKKIHGTVFEEFIRNSITYRYDLMCSIDAHEKKHVSYFGDGIIGSGY